MKKLAIVVFLSIFANSCYAQKSGIDVSDESLRASLQEYERLDRKHHAVIASDSESGERLTVLVRAINGETGEPFANQTIRVFQADKNGVYGERVAGDQTSARLSGNVQTDQNGRFMISTILPGDYGTETGNRHIHLKVPNAKPGDYTFFFDNFVGDKTRSWANSRDQVVLLKLNRMVDGVFLSKTDLPVRGIPR